MIPLKSRVYFVDSLKGIILRFVLFLNLNRFGELVSDDKYRLKKYKPFISPNNNNILMYVYMTFSYLLAKSPTEK